MAKQIKRSKKKSKLQALSPEIVESIKLASIKGVDDYSLAEQYGIAASTIRGRRRLDPGWQALVEKRRGPIKKKAQEDFSQKVAENTQISVQNSMESITERNGLMMADFIFRKLKQAVDTDSVDAPQNWAELATATKTLRNLTGQDKGDGPQIAISLFGDYNAHTDNVRDV